MSVRNAYVTACAVCLAALLFPVRSQAVTVVAPECQARFAAQDVNGVFVLFDPETQAEIVSDPELADTGYLPASTFKILHALIALETGVVSGPDELFSWDGKDRGYGPWNRDQTLRSAVEHSCVWVFQEIARRIGRERMQRYVDLADYGNRDISGALDSFWLDGGLRITPRQQTAFLQRLYAGELPFSRDAMEQVKDMILVEKTDAYALWAKTGWASRVYPQTGWLVGWVEKDGKARFFATAVEIRKVDDARARYAVSRSLLQDFGAL